jgi:hypothetical protein
MPCLECMPAKVRTRAEPHSVVGGHAVLMSMTIPEERFKVYGRPWDIADMHVHI